MIKKLKDVSNIHIEAVCIYVDVPDVDKHEE